MRLVWIYMNLYIMIGEVNEHNPIIRRKRKASMAIIK